MLARLLPTALTLALAGGPALAEDAPAPAAPPGEPPRAALLPREALQAQSLARRYPDQARWLEAGDERALALLRPAATPTPKGWVILLPGDAESADWPRALGPLRLGLAEHGWNTLAVSLPDPQAALLPDAAFGVRPADTPPAAPEAPAAAEGEPAAAAPAEAETPPEAEAETETETETETDEAAPAPVEPPQPPPRPYAERVDARLDAALALAAAQPAGQVVLLGHGSGAYWALRFAHQRPDAGIARVALVTPLQAPGERLPLAELLATLKQPVGDFYYRDGRSESAAAERRRQAAALGRRDYAQTGLSPVIDDLPAEQQRLVRRVRGWLERPPGTD